MVGSHEKKYQNSIDALPFDDYDRTVLTRLEKVNARDSLLDAPLCSYVDINKEGIGYPMQFSPQGMEEARHSHHPGNIGLFAWSLNHQEHSKGYIIGNNQYKKKVLVGSQQLKKTTSITFIKIRLWTTR